MDPSLQDSNHVEQTLVDNELVAFFTANPSIELYFKHFKDLSFAEFSSLTDAEIGEKIGSSDGDIILKFKDARTQNLQDVENELLMAANGDDSTRAEDDFVEVGVAVPVVAIKVHRSQSITSCIVSELQNKCDPCLHNASNNNNNQNYKLCDRLRSSSANNIPQIKPFPIGKFQLLVSDESFRNMLHVKGVTCNNVKKQVGGVIFEFLKSFFPYVVFLQIIGGINYKIYMFPLQDKLP